MITRGNVGGTAPFKPSETLATQVLQAALNAEKNSAEAKSVADDLRNDAANGKFDGKDGAKGDKGDTGPQGPVGPQGPQGEKGKDAEIPEDYPQIRKDVSRLKEDTTALQKRQNVLVGSETGNPVSCDDAFAAPLCGLNVYGKSTQDGTPTPDAPVPIVSVGDGGSVVVKVSDGNGKEQTLTLQTPTGLPGIPVPSGGNYTDKNGQQWVCDEVDLERGAKVQRVNRLKLGGLSWRYELTPTNKSDTFISDVPASQDGTTTGYSLCQYAVFDGVAYDIEMTESCRCYVWIKSATVQFKAGSGVNSVDAFSEWLKARPDASIYYCLATPIETPLTPAEIAAYKALTAYAPDTVVQVSDGAGVKLEYQRDVYIAIKKLNKDKLDNPANPVVGQILRVKSISDTGEITLETVSGGLPEGGTAGQVLVKKTDAEGDCTWVDPQTATVRTSMDDVALAGAKYILGEQAALSVTMPTDAQTGQEIMVVFSSGQTACTLAVDLDYFDFVPKANSMCKIVFLCVAADTWLVDAKEG